MEHISGSSVYAGIKICFTAYNVTETARERYNRALIQEAKHIDDRGQDSAERKGA